jgi:ubiquinone/menaquinone biosynthesis C-methylase UbiE
MTIMGWMTRIRAALRGKGPAGAEPAPTWLELWSPEMGQDYASFWDNMARDRAGAYLAVAGDPFGQSATEESLSRHGRETADIIAEVLEIGPQDRVLEVGVGVGRIAEHLAPRCGHFTGVDISENMIKFAQERLARFPNVSLKALPRSDLSLFEDSSFDKAYAQIVLIHLDREDAFIYMEEVFRVLSPGGRAWFQFYNLLHPRGFKEFKFAVHFMREKGAKTRGRVHCYTAAEVRFLVEQAGFRVREDLSALAPLKQTFSFSIPDTDWEFYLIAVGEKPGGS